MAQNLALIAAMTRPAEGPRVIGKNNQLPWRLPKELAYFKETTLGAYIIMGRRTFESLGRPLPGRKNIVITRMPEKLPCTGYWAVPTPAAALRLCPPGVKVFVIGGAQLYREYLPLAPKMYLTEIAAEIAGDAYFPEFDLSAWERKITRTEQEIINCQPVNIDYCEYTRR